MAAENLVEKLIQKQIIFIYIDKKLIFTPI